MRNETALTRAERMGHRIRSSYPPGTVLYPQTLRAIVTDETGTTSVGTYRDYVAALQSLGFLELPRGWTPRLGARVA